MSEGITKKMEDVYYIIIIEFDKKNRYYLRIVIIIILMIIISKIRLSISLCEFHSICSSCGLYRESESESVLHSVFYVFFTEKYIIVISLN